MSRVNRLAPLEAIRGLLNFLYKDFYIQKALRFSDNQMRIPQVLFLFD